MLRLVLASVVLGLTWSWLRAEFGRAIDEKTTVRKDALLVRGVAFAASLVWFLFAFGGVFGKLLVWGAVLAVVAVGAWMLLGGGGDKKPPEPASGGGEPPDPAA
jgi:hypothetical protein